MNRAIPYTFNGMEGTLRRTISRPRDGIHTDVILWTKGKRNIGHGPGFRVTFELADKWGRTWKASPGKLYEHRTGYYWHRMVPSEIPPELVAIEALFDYPTR